ncbi:MAG: ABC transporter substrate-binding protein [Oscillospiraceae bacterium]|jgi:peptide/nickel transport system substrate-binding protein|nr:ABC transporter substrate-binding protein [Oscillospiraceae bacterium]
MKKALSLMLALFLLLAVFAGCANTNTPAVSPTPSEAPVISATPEQPARISQIIIGTAADLETPSRAVYNFDVYSGTLLQLAPVYIDANAEIRPLATTFETSDYKTWRLTVIDGLTWHDGTPVTADDIKFTIEYNALQSTGEAQTTYEAINVINSSTVELVLPAANVRHLSSLTTLRLMPRHIFEGIEDYTTAALEQQVIGCGPYKFDSYNADARTYTFKAYDNFIWGQPNVDTVIFRSFDSVDTLNLALKAHEIDMIYAYAGGVGAAAAEDFKTADGITLLPVKDSSNTAVFVFNNNTAPGNDINIRKAVAYAIDYDKFHELFGSEYSVHSTAGFVPKGTYGYIDTPELTRDLAKAREYLAAAGATGTDGVTTAQYNGAPLSIELMVRSDIPVYERYAELLKANLAEVGIELVFNITDVPNFREITEKTHTNQAMVTKFTAFGMSMGAGMGAGYMSGLGSSNGQGQIMDEAFDGIVQKLKSAASPEDYLAAAAECQRYYADNMPAVALFWDSYIQAHSSELDGFTVDGTFGILNVNTWYSIIKK